jgi:hypothetical protein
MVAVRTQVVAIFVDKANQQWVAQDAEGAFWILPMTDNPWEHRRPFVPAADTELEPVPGHYKYVLGLPH